MSEEQRSGTGERNVDEERQRFGSAGWDALDDDTPDDDTSTEAAGELRDVPRTGDVPKPDPDKDQG
jgi:hypothetical protein